MRQSLRIWKSQPGFGAAVVLALALSIGANSALFTVINALLLRPLPFPHVEQLVDISFGERNRPLQDFQNAPGIESAAAYLAWNFPVTGSDGIRNLYSLRVTADLIPLLKISAAVGRPLTHDDFGRKIVMISHDYWARLGARPDVTSQTVTIDGQPYAIAGVLPADFFLGTNDVNLIVPDLQAGDRVLARLRPGVTAAQVQAEIAALVPGSRPQVTPFDRASRSGDGGSILLLQATAAFVLLITCANLANLQLVRGLSRRREFAIRTAVGASRGRLILQLTGESSVFALIGTALGLALTRLFHDLILKALPVNISRRLSGEDALSLDWRVLGFTVGIGLVTILLFGLLPALSSLRFDVMSRLRDAARGSSREKQRFGQALVTLEIALALMLLAGAGLTFKSLTQIRNQYLGFHPEGVLRAAVDLSSVRYPRAGQRVAVYEEIYRRVAAVPGVAAVGILAPQFFPFGGPAVRGARFEVFGKPEVQGRAEVYMGNPAYLESVRLPLLRGRWFTDSDTAVSPPVAVLSELVAHRYWGDDDPIGRRVRLNSDRPASPWVTIVGVVGDVKNPVADHWQPTAYRPWSQVPSSGAILMIRAAVADPQSLAGPVRRELHAIDPAAPELRMANLAAEVLNYGSPQRFTTILLAAFAVIGLMLASAGVYGVMRYWVASRTGEIGIRVALGAQSGEVMWLVLGRGARAAAAGVVAGLAGAIALRKVMATQLISVSPVDPMVLGTVSTVIFAVALLAAWAPARRASRVDPAEALRTE